MRVKGELFDDLTVVASRFAPHLADVTQPHLFDRMSWYELTHAHIDGSASPLIAHAELDGRHAWLFLRKRAGGQAEALGSWYTLAFRPVYSPATPEPARLALLTALARVLRPTLGQLRLEPVPEADGTDALLMAAFREAGWIANRAQKTGHWHTDIPDGGFSDFWAQRPGQLRSTHDRRAKKFPMNIRIHTQIDDALWADYQQIFAASWKGEEGSPAFLRAMADHASNAGALRLGIAHYEGKPVAAQLWTVDHGRAIIHKLAYRDDAAAMSPGTLLSAALFRHAIDADHVASISYGTGDDGYKRDWMDQREQLHILEFFNPYRLSGLRGASRSAVGRASSWLKQQRKI